MAAEHGSVVITSQDVDAGTATVTPVAQPVYGYAKCIKQRPPMFGMPAGATEVALAASVSGANLAIVLDRCVKAGDRVCWTSYDA
jgi:hypothetical protein